MARRLASLALALALAGCAAAPTLVPPPARPGAPSPPEPTEVPTPLPPAAAIPEGITPATSEVIARVWAVPDVTGPWPLVPVTVYADGSIVVPGVTGLRGPGVRRLTAGGLERLLGRLRSSELFATSRTIPPLRPGDSGFTSYTVEMHDAGRVASVTATNLWPSDEGRRLIELAEGILMLHDPAERIDPADWVGGSAAPLPYRATRTRLTVEVVAFPSGAWARPPFEIGALAWPLDASPFAFGEPIAAPGDPARTIRCAIVTGDAEARLRAALDAARLDSVETGVLTRSWDLSAPTVPGILRLSLRPYLPEETPSCAAADLPAAPEPQPPAGPGFAEAWTAARLDSSKQPALLLVLVEVYPDTEVPARAVPSSSVRWPRPVALDGPACDVASFAEADAVVRALEAAGARDTGGSPDQGEYDLAGPASDSLVRVSVRVVQPDELDPCGTIGF